MSFVEISDGFPPFGGNPPAVTATRALQGWEAAADWLDSHQSTSGTITSAGVQLVDVDIVGFEPVTLSGATLRLKVSDDRSPDVNHTWALSLIDEVGALEDGWAGRESLAPTSAVKASFRRLLTALPEGNAEPEVEVDPSTGSVSLRWFSVDGTRVFSLTCARGDEVIATLTTLGERPISWRHQTWNRSEIRSRIAEVDFLNDAA